ncbi:enoyl-CoA hydratase/isomerase family protein [Cupriavidus metallidurans]|uniref:Enoyl-CoA hydratase/isomerase n=1 Tax=Cupriavidus metallidurans (strain ATCC 43123 / DSM 2839 / NBRC 102507 / CH34) TaxID=266264 RepID=Q1LBU6_CUPMC|nr:enoyl-CoA hydratase/isomerase family protein [Cupriavidus metallidurans]ABF12380.1 Enoyl-CoA hydratase/isomerase [Cupriavidus metallidurans CH34]QGS32390.1 enoyl-CoA hydratase/isomerase family protein [Cupriavidus metallidurans]
MNDSDDVKLTYDGGIALVTLNRPQAKNALTPAMTVALTEMFRSFRSDEQVRVVVFAGAGADFCSGGDVKAMGGGAPRTTEQRRQGMAPYRDLVLAVSALDKPVIAAVDGVAYGAGLSLALLADIVLCSYRARMAAVFHRIGLVPDVGAWYTLPRVVGLQRAKELVFSAREFGSDEAKRMGLAMEVLAPEALMTRAIEIARSFESASGTAMSLSKQALQKSLQCDLETMLDLEATGQAIAAGSDYTRESIRRFAAKESPQFRWAPLPATEYKND